MKRRRIRSDAQGDLFETPQPQELRRRVRELDALISKALKKGEYDKAKDLTEQQKKLIQELVDSGEEPIEEKTDDQAED